MHTPAVCSSTADFAFIVFFYSSLIGLADADFAFCSQNEITVTQYVQATTIDFSVHILYSSYSYHINNHSISPVSHRKNKNTLWMVCNRYAQIKVQLN